MLTNIYTLLKIINRVATIAYKVISHFNSKLTYIYDNKI